MKKLEVSCAIIVRDGLLLAAQRSEEMSMPLKWEFPGGKLHHNESADDCLVREIKEELDITIAVRFSLSPSDWQYPNFAITLYPFVCDIVSGQIRLAEHKAIQWLSPELLLTVDWAAADIPVVHNYLSHFGA